MNIWQFRAVLNFDFETLHTASIDCIKQRFHVPNRWHFSPLQIGEHVPRRPNFRTRINMACIRKVGHTSRCISPLCSSLRFTVNIPIRPNRRRSTRGGSKQATNQPTNPSTGRNGLLKRRYEGGTRGRQERSTTVEFIRTTFVTSTRSIAGLR